MAQPCRGYHLPLNVTVETGNRQNSHNWKETSFVLLNERVGEYPCLGKRLFGKLVLSPWSLRYIKKLRHKYVINLILKRAHYIRNMREKTDPLIKVLNNVVRAFHQIFGKYNQNCVM